MTGERRPARRAAHLSALRRRLLAWYRHHRRDLPWRRTRDPYAVWVSEVMLQQTTVAAAAPFFERWMTRFPTVESLAAADEQEILTLWAGLGYYNRARNLHRAAKQIVEKHGGRIPENVTALLDLPGIGRYTAGAIASIAFDQPEPIVDANVTRVLARLFAVREEATSAVGQHVLWEIAAGLARTNSPGDMNQALMELGALVCTPMTPHCTECPVESLCRAARTGNPERFPVLPARPDTVEVTEVGAVIEREGRVLILRRPSGGKLGGLWEFPHAAVLDGDPAERLPSLVEGLTSLPIVPEELLCTIDYTFTHHQITLHVWRARTGEDRVHRAVHDDHRWATLAEIGRLPMSTPQRKIVQALTESGGGRQLDLLGAGEPSTRPE